MIAEETLSWHRGHIGKFALLVILLACVAHLANAQSATPATYPKITAYVGTIHPIVTFSENKPAYNFDHAYTGGL